MISHTLRVFKLMYIVAGILISNEQICDTVDRIQIAPRVEMKELLELRSGGGGGDGKGDGKGDGDGGSGQQGKQRRSPGAKRLRRKLSVTELAGGVVRGVTSKVTSKVTSTVSSRVARSRLSWLVNDAPLILAQWRKLALSFTVWTIPNWLMESTSGYISRKLFLSSDCDMIYK